MGGARTRAAEGEKQTFRKTSENPNSTISFAFSKRGLLMKRFSKNGFLKIILQFSSFFDFFFSLFRVFLFFCILGNTKLLKCKAKQGFKLILLYF